MIHRLALALASVAALLTLALALGLAGLTPAPVQLTAGPRRPRRRPARTLRPRPERPGRHDLRGGAGRQQTVTVHRISKTGVDDEHESGGHD